MSFRTETLTLEEKVAAIEEQLRRTQTGLETIVIAAPDLSVLPSSEQVADVELLGWLGLVMA